MASPVPRKGGGAAQMLDRTKFNPDDTFIAVMGVTGSGKSTFIAECCEEARQGVGHGLASVTQDIQVFTFLHGTKKVHLIDTPGFDDTYRTDSDVLRDLAYWLTKSYGGGFRLTGIIYLHPITATRMGHAAFKNLRTFQKLCGEKSMASVVLVTTMWSNVTNAEGEFRETELKNKEEWWGRMIKNNSSTYRHDGSRASAMAVVGKLVGKGTTVLELQTEMVDLNRDLDATEAGREVDSEMIEQREKYERELEDSRQAMEEAVANKDKEMIEVLAKEQEKTKAEIDANEKGREDLRTSFENLIKQKEKEFQEYKAIMEAKQEQHSKKSAAMEVELETAKAQAEQSESESGLILQASALALEKGEQERQQMLAQMLDQSRLQEDRIARAEARQDEYRRQQQESRYQQKMMEQQQQFQMQQQEAMYYQQMVAQQQAQAQQFATMSSMSAGGLAGGALGMAAISAGCSVM